MLLQSTEGVGHTFTSSDWRVLVLSKYRYNDNKTNGFNFC